MKITLELSMYPLDADYKPAIRTFVKDLRAQAGIDTVTNQMSTQVRGEFGDVMRAVNVCIERGMAANDRVVFVTKIVSSELDIDRAPDLE